jgi:hypothetical protein
MNIRETWNELTGSIEEALKKPFYSNQEATFEKFKDSSQNFPDKDAESTFIPYDPFGGYVNNQIQNAAANVLNYNDFVRRWREVSQLPEVDNAIQEITSEAIVYDEEEDVVKLNLDDIELPEAIKTKMVDSFDKIIYLLDFNERGEELFRQWYVDGTLTFEVVFNNRKPKDGLQKLVLLPPYNIFKFKNEASGEVKWFVNSKATYNVARDLEDAEKSYYDEQICQIVSGKLSPDKKMHYSHLQKAIKTINQLYLIEDSLIMMRLTKSTEKRVFYIDTGNLPKSKAEEYIRNLITKYRQKKVYNTELGTIENKNKTVSVLEDFWFPVNSSGKGTRVENLPGIQANFSAFDDVNYFVDKVYDALQIPKTRRVKETRMVVNNNLDIEQDEMKFYKFILSLRRKFNNLFVDLLKKDLLARQVMSIGDWKKIQEKIKFDYANSNEISLIKKMQVLQIKMDAAGAAVTLVDMGIVDAVWIQKTLLSLTDEEINEIAQRRQQAGAMGAGGAVDALGNPTGAGGEVPEGQETPGYEEIGGTTEPKEGEEPEPEPSAVKSPTKGNRFKQKAKESLNQEVLNNLREGDIITDGKVKLLFTNGKLQAAE